MTAADMSWCSLRSVSKTNASAFAPLGWCVFALLLAGCAGTSSTHKSGLVSLPLTEEATDAAFAGRRFALLVGVGTFDDTRWTPLRYAAKDARDMAAVLRDDKFGAYEDVVVLTSPADTTRSRILSELAALKTRATRPTDVVLVYFSSHGTLARDNRGELRRYLATSDARFHEAQTSALSIDQLTADFEQLGSRRRVMMLATCHSGAGKSLLTADVLAALQSIKSGQVRPLEEVSRASIVLAASDFGETAREDESLQNDVYTHFFVQGLRGAADRNLDGAVSASEAHDHARRATYAFTEGRQRPSADILEVGADPVVLSGRVQRVGQPELFSYSPRLEGFTLKVDNEVKAQLPGGAAVRDGTRRVQLEKGGEVLLDTVVELAPGERLALEKLAHPDPLSRAVYLTGTGLSFLDARSRSEVLPPGMLAGVTLRVDRVLTERLSLWVDVGAFRSSAALNLERGGRVPFVATRVRGAAAIAYTGELGRARLFTGPRVAVLWLNRSFDLKLLQSDERFVTATPGWMMGASVRLTQRVELAAVASVMPTLITVNSRSQLLGLAELMVGLGYAF